MAKGSEKGNCIWPADQKNVTTPAGRSIPSLHLLHQYEKEFAPSNDDAAYCEKGLGSHFDSPFIIPSDTRSETGPRNLLGNPQITHSKDRWGTSPPLKPRIWLPTRPANPLEAVLSSPGHSLMGSAQARSGWSLPEFQGRTQSRILSSSYRSAARFPKAVARGSTSHKSENPSHMMLRQSLPVPPLTSPLVISKLEHRQGNPLCQAPSPSFDSENNDKTISEVPAEKPISTTSQEDFLMEQIKKSLETIESYRALLHTLDQRDRAQKMMDLCQSVLESRETFETEFGRILLVFMQRLSKSSGAVPALYDLGLIKITDNDLVHGGAFGDVYKTRFSGEWVCIKKIRVIGLAVDDERRRKFHKQLVHEGILWWQLRHPNVLPLYGVCMQTAVPYLISPWMEHGDVNAYLRKEPSTNRYLLVKDVLKGLDYLHNLDLIHGDIKGANILVDSRGHATLADFGLSSIFDETIPRWESHHTVASKGGTCRWQAPELFHPTMGDEEPYNTKESDIYAWGCVCYEVFTGRLPFYEISRCEMVVLGIIQGQKPTLPTADHDAWQKWGLREDFWSAMMDKCWARHPANRPTVQSLLLDKLWASVEHDTRLPPCEYESPERRQVLTEQPSLLESLLGIEVQISAMHKE